MKNYLEKKDYQRNNSFILVAPTGTGKTTALIEYLRETKEQCIFVSPLNSLAKQVYEKGQGLFQLINCENKIESILGDIHYALLQGRSIIISLNTFIKYKNMFYKYNVYIDECHILTDYKELMDTDGIAQDIRNKKFKKIVGLTATAFGLDKLLNLEIIKPNVKPKSTKFIKLHWMKELGLENLVAMILELFKVHKKIVFLLNNRDMLLEIKDELCARNINVKIYDSQTKEISVINEHFSCDFDVILCTSSLATGVSIKDNFYSVYVPQSFDNINLLAQYFSRNRSEKSYGCVLKKFYTNKIDDNIVLEHKFFGKTKANQTLIDNVHNKLVNINIYSNKDMLDAFVNTSGDYVFEYGERYNLRIELLSTQRFKQIVEDQRQYFIDNQFPKFNKRNYPYLYQIYEICNIIMYGCESDELLVGYADEIIKLRGSFVTDRGKLYDECIKKVLHYKTDKCIKIAKQSNSDSIDIDLFEELFLDKPYVKKEFRDLCMQNFAIKKEVFKNKETINIFLNQLGYCLKFMKTGSILRKL